MAIRERMSGNEAVAHAIKQINPDVMAAFPITPSTEIPQMVSTFIANGDIDTEFIPVESEHSSMSATMGACAAGARAITATSSCGLAYMWEVLYVAASDRLPIVMAVVNRALTGPININCDHSDSMGARDAGWIQIYAETIRKPTTITSRRSALQSIRTLSFHLWLVRMVSSPAMQLRISH